MNELWQLMWSRFKVIAGIVGDIEASIIAIGFYFTILIPFGLLARMSGKSLKPATTVTWLNRQAVSSDMNTAKRQG